MSGFFNKVVGSIVELDEKPAAPAPRASAPAQNTTSAPTPTTVSGLDSEMVDTINAAVLTRKTDYTVFLDAAVKLEAIIPGEDMRYKAALASVTGASRTPQSIIQAMDLHLHEVDVQLEQFKRTSEAQRGTQVSALRSAADAKKAENTRITDQIAKLTQQITDLTAQAHQNEADTATAEAKASEAEADIARVETNFSAAAEHVRKSLQDRKQLLTTLSR